METEHGQRRSSGALDGVRRNNLRHHPRSGTSRRGLLGYISSTQQPGQDRQAKGVHLTVDCSHLGEDKAC